MVDPLNLARELVASLEMRSGHMSAAMDTLSGKNDEGDLVSVMHKTITGMVDRLGNDVVYDMLVAPDPKFQLGMHPPKDIAL